MTDPRDEHRLRELLDDAVSGVEPRNALDQIRARTKESPMTNRRPWIWGVGGAVVATAATVALIAAVGTPGDDQSDDQDPAVPSDSVSQSVDPSTDVTPDETGAPDPSESGEPAAGKTYAAGIYYLGDSPGGAALYREFRRVPEATRLLDAVRTAMSIGPEDPDYRTPWPDLTTVEQVSFDGVGDDGVYGIRLASAPQRPAGMSEREASLAVQQLIYTVQAAGGSRAPVQFYVGNNPVAELLGVPTSEPLSEAKELDVLSHVSLTSPTEGQVITDGLLKFEGRASSFEATVPWQIRQGEKVLKQYSVSARGWLDKLYPFSGQVKIADLPPGTYTFVAMTDDPTGGAEGNGPSEDSRTIIVK